MKLCWAGASVGRSGLATQAIAAFDVALWDLKAKRAGLPLAKLLGSYRDSRLRTYNVRRFPAPPIEQVLDNAAASLEAGIGGIKLKVGQPNWRTDVARVSKVREFLDDDVPLMVDANQQWDRATAQRMVAFSRSSGSSGSRNRWTPMTLRATPTWPAPRHPDRDRRDVGQRRRACTADRHPARPTSSNPTLRASAASPSSSSSPRSRSRSSSRSLHTSRWRSTAPGGGVPDRAVG